ncbi:MAG: DUF748 domain-containing protein [Burkholderiales bacterium]|nr:DUF748 domain-containing protein [Burkholderiales bacterium]
MKTRRLTRILIGLIMTLAVLAGAAYFGLRYATQLLKTQVETALGSDAEIGEIVVGWSEIVVNQVTIHAPKGWPAADALRAKKITIVPDLRGLLSDRSKVHIHRIRIDEAFLSILRTRDGKVRLLPSLLEKPVKKEADKTAADSPAIHVILNKIELHDGAVEFFDASVRQPAHKMRFEKLQATVKDLRVPDLSGRTGIALEGIFKGVRRDGKLSLAGWAELATKDSHMATTLAGVDLIALQPYLIKAAETGVKRGTLDLSLKSTVKNKHLHAPGTVILTDLELNEKGGTFMGIPRQAVIASLKNRKNQITVNFALNGNIDDPKFSLNDSFAKNIGAGVAGLLGLSIEGLTESVGSAAQGVGSVFKKLFSK